MNRFALAVKKYTATSSLGRGCAAQYEALTTQRSGLTDAAFEDCRLPAWTGQVAGLDQALIGQWKDWDCRNNRLAALALETDGFADAVAQARQDFGASRIGVFVGTSTSGVRQTERAYAHARDGQLPADFRYQQTQNTYSVADFVQQRLQLSGPCMAISTACTSSAKVFASAWREIQTGACDAAVVGGVDSLCLTTLYGFNSLQLVSPEPCRPADQARCGISIGEAGGFALLVAAGDEDAPRLLGYGESSDAHHMSAPQPEGLGAIAAMQAALTRAGMTPDALDYLNLHGTATKANDLAEARAVQALFGRQTPCSSTKGWTGHTLGAAGIVEAVISLLCLEHGFLPRSLNTLVPDPEIKANILMDNGSASLATVMSNSFGFGGSNCSLLFGAAR